jgi:hypothetical protein
MGLLQGSFERLHTFLCISFSVSQN